MLNFETKFKHKLCVKVNYKQRNTLAYLGYVCERHALFIYLLLQFVALKKRKKNHQKKERKKNYFVCVTVTPEVTGDQILVYKNR